MTASTVLFFLVMATIMFVPGRLHAQLKGEDFVRLLSSPPVVEEFLAEHRYAGTKPTDYYFGRWQSNAFVLSVSTNLAHIETGGGVGELADVRGQFDDEAWTVFGANRPLKIGILDSVSPSNEVVVANRWALGNVGRLLNAGITHAKPGQIAWGDGLTYAVTNDAKTIVVSGVLKTDLSGIVSGANMEIAVWPMPGIAGGGVPTKHQWELEYEYDTSISASYPSVVKRFVLKSGDRFLRDEIRIIRIKLADAPLARSAFSYVPFIFTNSTVFRGTNDGFIYLDSFGDEKPLRFEKPDVEGSRPGMIPILFIGAMLILPIILFKLVKRN